VSDSFTEAYFDIRSAARDVTQRIPLILAIAILGAAVGAALGFVLPKQYTARAAFSPVTSSNTGQASDLLRNLPFGLSSGSNVFGGAITTSEIYPDLLSTSNLLGRALRTPYSSPSTSIGAALGYAGKDSVRSLERSILKTRKRVHISLNKSNGIVTIEFADRNPKLAAAFLNSMLVILNELNTTTRQTQAGSVRKFLEKRIVEAREDLAGAEEALAGFRLKNVRFANAPQLALEESRLERRIRISEAVYQTLSQQFEFARIDEARDTPTLNVVEPPTPPVFPSTPGPFVLAAFGGAIAAAVTLLYLIRGAWVVVPRRVAERSGMAYMEPET